MKIAVLGRTFSGNYSESLSTFFENVFKKADEIYIYEPFYNYLKTLSFNLHNSKTFSSYSEINNGFNFFFSLGGDGTFLESVRYVRDTGVPIIGINIGRLGFLANISQNEINSSLDYLFSGNYIIENRSLISVKSNNNLSIDFPFGLNEVTVQKHDTSLITIHALVGSEEINTYWTDGLIISTPTGSTAYSLSVGGPIVAPDCRVLILSPIASHNLTVRPLVVSDSLRIKLKVVSRSGNFIITIDSITQIVPAEVELELTVAGFQIQMVNLPNHKFYSTIRKKLMWGADIRN